MIIIMITINAEPILGIKLRKKARAPQIIGKIQPNQHQAQINQHTRCEADDEFYRQITPDLIVDMLHDQVYPV